MTPTRRRTGIQLDPDQVRYASGQAEGTPPVATPAAPMRRLVLSGVAGA